jgi:hypothetical protein
MGAATFSSRPVAAYLNPPLVVNSAIRDSRAHEVLIYYSNGTAPDDRELEDYHSVIGWLYDSGDPKLAELAREFELDLTHFPLMVGRDLGAIEGSLSRADSSLYGIILATNPIAREKRVRVWKPTGKGFSNVPLAVRAGDSDVERSNPLATRVGLEAVLRAAGTIFDPKTYNFILVIKSHGTEQLLLTPRLVTPAALGREGILAIARGSATLGNVRPGVTKSDFTGILSDLDRNLGMRFSLIFLESCESGAQLQESGDLPSNIGTIVSTDETGAQSNTISYETYFDRLYGGLEKGQTPSSILLRYLEERRAVLNPHPTASRIKFHFLNFLGARGIYFIPLLLLLGFTFLQRVRWPKRA